MSSSGGSVEATASSVSKSPRLFSRFKVRLEFEDLRCLLGGTTEWLEASRFFVPSGDPIEPGHMCRFEIGLGRRGPWLEGEAEVVRAVRLATREEPTGTELAIRALSEEAAALLSRLMAAHREGGDDAVAALALQLAEAHDAEVPTEAMPTAIEPSPDPADETAPVLEDEEPSLRERTLVLDDPRPARSSTPEPTSSVASPADPRGRPGLWIGLLLVLVAAVLGAAWWWWRGSQEAAAAGDRAPAGNVVAASEPSASVEVSPWVQIDAIRWEPLADGLEVRLESDRPVGERGFRHYRLEGEGSLEGEGPRTGESRSPLGQRRERRAAARELLKLYGAVQAFDERFFPVGGTWLSQIRTGSHFIEGVDELHIVFDLASPEVHLEEVRIEEATLVVLFSKRAGGPEESVSESGS